MGGWGGGQGLRGAEERQEQRNTSILTDVSDLPCSNLFVTLSRQNS